MSPNCCIEKLLSNTTLQLKLMDISNIKRKCDTDTISVQDVTEQISNIAQTQMIEKLSLQRNKLLFLPDNSTQCLLNLIHLDLSKNQLTNLPKSLNVLKKLLSLNVSGNKFSQFPSVVSELSNLKTLMVCENQIREVPDDIANLTNLKDLDLSCNMLNDLPSSCANLHYLQNLSLANNEFRKIPNCVANGMQSLQTFNISRNLSVEINISPTSTKLTGFYAEKNNMCPSFPTWILNLKFSNLEEVLLDETQFQEFALPKEFSKSHIRKLSMKQCELSDSIMEKIVAGMVNLEELIIGNIKIYYANSFWCIPIQSLKKPSSLKRIDVSNTEIPIVPKTISNFVNLSVIDLSSNTINWLPEEICSLKYLSSLLVHKNHLAVLPERIGELVSLKELKACDNNLCKLPDTMKSLINLQYLDLYDNEFEMVPEAIKWLPELIGLDLEQNYFPTEDLLLDRDVHYESMRDILRDHWQEDSMKLDRFKSKPPEEVESLSDDERRSSSSSCSSIDNSLQEDALCSLPEKTLDNFMDERWDTSEDSADDFDPHECREPRRKSYSPFTFYRPSQRLFLPAQSHAPRVITRVMEMLKNGSLVWPTSYEEGQFEDL